ncbi:MAG: DUF2868 domain-containing protein [Pseudomonadota bacterium]
MMKYGLKDIIDLDYLVHRDDDLETDKTMTSRLLRDRAIYDQIKDNCKTEKDLLLHWLGMRKNQYLEQPKLTQSQTKPQILPGTLYSILYRWMVFAMVFLGLMIGFSMAGLFLVYHGSQPVNVTIFFSLFVCLPLAVTLFSLLAVCLRSMGKIKNFSGSVFSVFQSLLGAVFFDVLPMLLKKIDWLPLNKELNRLEYTTLFVRMKTREYQGLFFWPFFMLTCIFAAGFSSGALGATFFKILVSDMAFGWQSTLITSTQAVHELVSFIALPWSIFMPESLAFPGFDQIEGSRIILKEGISVLATKDLVSWWPFMCMGILVYSVVPRMLLIIVSIRAQNRIVHHFDFGRPEFRQLIIRMTSLALDVEPPEQDHVSFLKAGVDKGAKQREDLSAFLGTTALILASDRVYPEPIMAKIKSQIEHNYGVKTAQTIALRLNARDFTDLFVQIDLDGIDPVILVYEVWQPPIRGLLHAIVQIRQQLPRSTSLWVLLTNDAGLEDLSLSNLFLTDQDEQFEVWQMAVRKLDDPMIIVKRFVSQ